VAAALLKKSKYPLSTWPSKRKYFVSAVAIEGEIKLENGSIKCWRKCGENVINIIYQWRKKISIMTEEESLCGESESQLKSWRRRI
jgi:hypothetical protein